MRRRPEESALWRAVQRHLASFVARAEERGRTVPTFVRRQLRALLDCGLLSHGFLRVRCECGHERWVAFSCKGRGLCPSCGGRRMAETAAHLADHVVPVVPVRQWVLSLPRALRTMLGYDPALLGAALGMFVRAVFGWIRVLLTSLWPSHSWTVRMS